jgi:hypothetical protein
MNGHPIYCPAMLSPGRQVWYDLCGHDEAATLNPKL